MAFSPENSAGFQIENRQVQHQGLSQKQRQSLELLQLSLPELEQRLNAELAVNPFIEVEEAPPELQAQEADPGDSREPPDGEDENALEAWEAENGDVWRDELPLPADPAESTDSPAADFLLFSQAPGPSLQESLLQELALSKIPRGVSRKVCEALIDQLDEEGFLRTPVADVAMNCDVSAAAVEKALEFVQGFDPPGVGARSLQECWLLQLDRRGELTENFRKLLTELTGDLERNRPDEAARKLHISMEELEEMFRKLRRLNRSPVPAERAAAPVQPDLEIAPDGKGGFRATLTRERRNYRLSPYAEMADAPDAGADFAAKIKDAKNLLEALQFRKSTLLRLGEMLIDVQRAFLEEGPEKLRPFTMKQAAEYLEFKSESTVSRAAAGKYVLTPHGLFPLRYFFSAGYVSEEGGQVSRRADMELLKKLIDGEDKHTPLSDEKLSELLRAAGHPVARRTVVKYRELMKIPNSSMRKEHF